VAAQASAGARTYSTRAQLAWWAFEGGSAGAVASMEAQRRLTRRSSVLAGFEEQHGTRRDPALFTSASASGPMRQGWWCGWQGRAGPHALELKHELRGQRAFARSAVRRELTARAESALPLGASLAWTHTAWSTRGGETLYLSETDGDRLTLHPTTGLGQRTRLELSAPALGGCGHASVEWTETPTGTKRPAWTLEWTRRSH
jgi:hypothetical protein